MNHLLRNFMDCYQRYIALSLPGAGFLILPVYLALLALSCFVITQKSYKVSEPYNEYSAFIIVLLFKCSIGFNKILYGSILTVLTFTLLLLLLVVL
jgi:hypothetical protein